MEALYKKIFDDFSNTCKIPNWQTTTRRGFCGKSVTEFFTYLLNISGERFNIVKNDKISMIHDNLGNKYFKRLSFDGSHYAILISNTNGLEIADEDYILDFTYKQMIVNSNQTARNAAAAASRSATLAAVNAIGIASDYLLLPFSEIKDRFSTAKWQKNYVAPVKSVISAARPGMRGAGGRKRKTRRRFKK